MEKCGEIMLSNKTKFIFVCAFCNEEFKEMLSFGKHLHQDHLKLDNNEFEDLKETTTTGSQNEEVISTLSLDQTIFDSDNIGIGLKRVETLNELNYVPVEAIYLPTSSEHKKNTDSYDDLEPINPERQNQHTEESYIFSQRLELERNESNRTSETLNNEDNTAKTNPNYIFKCEDCDREFRTRPQLVLHTRIHTGRKNHICPHCSKRFIIKKNLVIHIRTHTGERPFKCTHCHAAFKCKINLNTHIRRHLGEKRHACNICDKRFVESSEVKIHMRSHTGEKPYQCDECGANFSTSSKLSAHKKRHANIKNHKCKICGKEFFSTSDLKLHLAVHSKERPFQCEICLVTYPRKGSLREHMKIHSSVKKYICTICSKAFAQYAGLYSHMKSHGIKLGQMMKAE